VRAVFVSGGKLRLLHRAIEQRPRPLLAGFRDSEVP
jgi:hypothetical protein